ncbi:uncharacterized protein LOC133912676 [Phragmites australis]|uniref:uncharacterized protein LOC133912676 n=1 Tax=Phragmites australis TaxID=29695 RepID=UPI002D77013A|nr:uncharacterized protein LOC133912676 [Phragmites australis]XP_062211525.1 uncharacterized protein LOC133912676 [Phragmites australis]
MMSSPPPPPPPQQQPDAPLPLPPLPVDIQVEILSGVGDAISVVRCAATCKAWRRLIQETSFLSHLHRRRGAGIFDHSSLLGFFFRDISQRLPRRRLYRRRPTRFLLLVPSQSRPSLPVVLPLSRFLTTSGDLEGFAPVASGTSGLVALCRFQGASRDPAAICVCNPLAGTSTFLPPLPLFVPEKILFLETSGSSFRLLAVMDDQQGGLLLRVFSSQTGDWDAPVTADLPDNMMVLVCSPAAVHCGAVYWICGTPALPHAVHAVAVRLAQAGASVSRIDLPPRAGVHRLTVASRAVRLANSAQGTLSLVLLDELVLSVWNLEDSSADRKRWSCCKAVYLMPMLPPIVFSCNKVELSIQGLCEKSGSLFLRVMGVGLFVLNLETKKLVKVCKDHFVKHLCPYVTDFASCLAAMKRF